MKYNIIIFDLDDTVLDFTANERCSLNRVMEGKGIEDKDRFRVVYKAINHEMWESYSKGEIDQEELLDNRFSRAMKEYDGSEINGREWDVMYRENLSKGGQIMDGALEMLEALHKTHRLFIATNGVHETQENRIRISGIGKYFENVFDSDTIGFRKPDKRFFEYIMRHVEGFEIEKALMVGDNIHTDIAGAKNAGIATCLFKYHSEEPEDNISDYFINDLSELENIVK